MSLLQELAGTTRQVAERVAPAVVRIGRGGGLGSGIVVGPDQVLTNAHNLRGAQATVLFADGRSALGDVVGADLDGDLAVLRVDTAGTTPIEWSDATPGLGDVVFTVARSAGGTPRTTWGIVSANE